MAKDKVIVVFLLKNFSAILYQPFIFFSQKGTVIDSRYRPASTTRKIAEEMLEKDNHLIHTPGYLKEKILMAKLLKQAVNLF